MGAACCKVEKVEPKHEVEKKGMNERKCSDTLEEAAKECLRTHEAEAGHSGNKWAQSWDGGMSFHYGQPGTDDIPADSARHRAEAKAFRCVAAQDAADAPDQASREVNMVNRGVFVWWLLLCRPARLEPCHGGSNLGRKGRPA